MVQVERTNWRDQQISERHRLYGDEILLTDMDFTVIEYLYSINTAVIDYKLGDKPEFNYMQSSPILAQIRHCDDLKTPIPFLIVRYWPGPWLYQVIPLNRIGIQKTNEFGISRDDIISEVKYVTFLYWLRGLDIPDHIIKCLKE